MNPRFVPFLTLLLSLRLFAVPGDEQWDTQFFAPGFGTGQIGARTMVATSEGDLICAGLFSSVAGGKPGTANIARWNGTNWTSVGGGLPGATIIFAVSVWKGNVIVGGSFTSVQGQAITNLASWNGTNWSAVGGGVTSGSVRALAALDGILYAGGLFTNAGGTSVKYVSSWDGTNWNNLNGGVQANNPSSAAPPIQSLLAANGSIYAGGAFYSAGGVSASNVARWTGSAWESVGGGAENGTDSDVVTLAVGSGGIIYLGGAFARAGTSVVGNIAAWNGTNWSSLAGGVYRPSFGTVSGLAVHRGDLFVVGSFTRAGADAANGFARWDGTKWYPVDAPLNNPIIIASNGSDVFAAGTLTSMMSRQVNGLVRIKSGGVATVIGAGITGNAPVVQTVNVNENLVQVGGLFDGQARHAVAQWDGENWAVLGNGLFSPFGSSQSVNDLLSVRDSTYAVGQFLSANNSPGTLARLANNYWTNVNFAPLADGFAVIASGEELFVGHGQGVSRWTGTRWTQLGAGLQGAVYALAFAGGDLFAGGSFTNSGTVPLKNIARWNGTNWSSVDGGVNGTVFTLAPHRGGLVVGGRFTEAGGVPCYRIASWKGAWMPQGSGFGNGVSPVTGFTNDESAVVYDVETAPDGLLYAGGNFTTSGTNLTKFIAAWDGTNWSSLGSGLNYLVRDIASDGKSLYLGGDFVSAGTNASIRFARWRLAGNRISIFASAPPSVSAGSNLTYSIRVKNSGESLLNDVHIESPAPSGATFVEAESGGVLTNDHIVWNIGDLAPDQEVQFALTVRVNASSGSVVLQDYLASANGKSVYGPAVRTTVIGFNGAPVVSVLEPANGSTFPILSDVRVSFAATDVGHGLRQVDVYREGSFIASLFSAPYTLVLSNLRAGTYQITGVSSDFFHETAETNITFTVLRPANDNFTNRIVLSGTSAVTDGFNLDATVEPGEPNHDGFWKNNSIWWTWTAPTEGRLTLDSTGSDFSHLLGLYRGTTLTSLYALALAKNDPGPRGSILARDVQAGTNYQIVIDGGYPFTEGHASLRLSFDYAPVVVITAPTNGQSFLGPTNLGVAVTATDVEGAILEVQLLIDNFVVGTDFQPGIAIFQIPNLAGGAFSLTAHALDSAGQQRTSSPKNINVSLANDMFANRVRIGGYRFVGFGTTAGASSEPGEPADPFPFDGPRKSVWWEWTAPVSTNVTIMADSAEFSAGIQVYTGTIGGLSLVASHINDFGHNEVTFAASAGSKYQISVDGFHFQAGTASGKYRMMGFVHGSESVHVIVGQPSGSELPLEIEAPYGSSFVLQTSIDLVDWVASATNTMVGTKTNIIVVIGSQPKQFYRVVLRP